MYTPFSHGLMIAINTLDNEQLILTKSVSELWVKCCYEGIYPKTHKHLITNFNSESSLKKKDIYKKFKKSI